MTKPMPHVITGEPDLVYAALRRADEEGRLAAVTEARILSDERVRLVAHLRAPARGGPRWQRVRPWLVGAGKLAAVLAVVGVVAGLVWLTVLAVMAVVALVTAVIAWIHAHLAALVMGAVLLVLLLLACLSGGGCGGMHCGGCRG